MFNFFRKHRWILIVSMTLTVISFVFWNVGSRMNGDAGRASGNYGTIYGKKITALAYANAAADFKLFYFFHYGTWPEKSGRVSENDMEREVYLRLMLNLKAESLGIHVGDDAVVAAANQMLRTIGRDGQAVPLDAFVTQVLQPEGLVAADFERFVRHDLTIQQLVQSLGLSGELITPQEAAGVYEREHKEVAAQIVFFAATNYLSTVTAPPAAVAQFYTNYLAAYRLPDRVQVSYVAFGISNYLAQAKTELAKTNFDQQIDGIYAQYGAKAFPEAKTPAEAKDKIRETLIRQRALADAKVQANDFANAVFSQDPARAENLAAVAKQKGFAVQTTAPFASTYGPEEFSAPAEFTKSAFSLTTDEPFAGPIVAPEAVYVIALAKQLPSEIPPLADIRPRVIQDFEYQQAIAIAQRAGTNFAQTAATALANGKSFASAAVALGLAPQVLPPFSLSTQELPALEERAELNLVKQAAFTTPVGKASGLAKTADGGFVIYVQSQLPVDQATMNTELPQFTASLRRARENEAFSEWIFREQNRELLDTPLAQQAQLPQLK
jgi:hypothetical protein